MRRLARKTLYTQQTSDDARLNQLERRIPSDYPINYAILLGDTGSVGPGTYNFGWAFTDPCPDPTGVACEQSFVTDGDYLFLPSGYNDTFIVTMNAALGSGSSDNYLTPVSPGDIAPTNLIKIGFIAYIATDNVVDTGSFTVASQFVTNMQEPPPYRSGGYARVWSQYRVIQGQQTSLAANDRWALRPFVQVLSPIVSIGIHGLVMAVTLLPPGGTYGGASWAG